MEQKMAAESHNTVNHHSDNSRRSSYCSCILRLVALLKHNILISKTRLLYAQKSHQGIRHKIR